MLSKPVLQTCAGSPNHERRFPLRTSLTMVAGASHRLFADFATNGGGGPDKSVSEGHGHKSAIVVGMTVIFPSGFEAE